MRLKSVLKKVLICLLIIFLLNNFIMASFTNNVSYAASNGDKVLDALTDVLGTVVGLLTWPVRLVAVTVGLAIDRIMGTVAFVEGGETIEGQQIQKGATVESLTPFDILFDNIELLKVNFFQAASNQSSILAKFRSSVAFWYYALRNISAAILLCILIYVGIRMALSTVSASQKASYKKMLVDWVVSLAIIFLLQYIMLFTLYINSALVDAIRAVVESQNSNYSIKDTMDGLALMSLTGIKIESIAAVIVYCMLVFQTLGLFISYFNRMLKIGFLIIISPLITLTYSIDKMGDGKAQALNTWLKEFVFSILIQPFHCIIYMTFVSVAFTTLKGQSSGLSAVANSVIAILCINFIKEGEKIVRKIFAFADDNQHTSLTAGMAVAGVAASKAKSIGKSTRKAVNGVKNLKSTAGSSIANATVEAVALGRVLSGKNTNEDGSQKSFEEVKSEVRAEQYTKKAEKEEKKKYGVSEAQNQQLINDRCNLLMQAGMNQKEAYAKARLSIAQETRKARKQDKSPKVIRRARGVVSSAKNIVQQSEVLRELGNMKNTVIASGMGLAFGSGTYGTTGNLTQAAMVGVGTYSGVKEFMKNSNKTIRDDTNQRLQSLGANGKTEAAVRINTIIANGSKYEGTDELDKIMKEIEKALEQVGVRDKNVKNNIKQTIQSMAQRNPSASVNDLVDQALTANGISGLQRTPQLLNATNNLATFTQEKGIYDNIKQAGDIGTSPDAFIEGVLKSYEGRGGSTISITTPDSSRNVSSEQFIEDAVDITADDEGKADKAIAPDNEKAEEFISDRNEEELQEFYRYCDREIEKVKRDIENSDDSEIEELKARLNQIEAARLKIQEAALDREIARLNQKYEESIKKDAIDLGKEAQRKLDRELAKLQTDYDKCVAEVDQHFDKENIQGIKSQEILTIQRNDLEGRLQEIDNARRNLRDPNKGGKL